MAKNQAAVALGSLGGRVKSERKAASSRANGKKGGRPPSLVERVAAALHTEAAGTRPTQADRTLVDRMSKPKK